MGGEHTQGNRLRRKHLFTSTVYGAPFQVLTGCSEENETPANWGLHLAEGDKPIK